MYDMGLKPHLQLCEQRQSSRSSSVHSSTNRRSVHSSDRDDGKNGGEYDGSGGEYDEEGDAYDAYDGGGDSKMGGGDSMGTDYNGMKEDEEEEEEEESTTTFNFLSSRKMRKRWR